MTEHHQLDALTLDEAKGILCQIGYFADDTCFLSLRLTPSQYSKIQDAANSTVCTTEELLAELCRLHAIERGPVEAT